MDSAAFAVQGHSLLYIDTSNNNWQSLVSGRGYSKTVGEISESDLTKNYAPALRHEQFHRDNAPGEPPAYAVSLQVLNKFVGPNAFKNFCYFTEAQTLYKTKAGK